MVDYPTVKAYVDAFNAYLAALEVERERLNAYHTSGSSSSSSSSALSRQDKGARLNLFGRDSYCSDHAKVDMIRKIKEHGIPDAASRSSFQRARREECSQQTNYGMLVQPLDATNHW